MQAVETRVFARQDTMFGICEAIGEDFGFSANWLRVALAVGLLWNPAAMFGAYAVLGVIVLVSRLLCPNPRMPRPATQAEAEPASAEPIAEPSQMAELAEAA